MRVYSNFLPGIRHLKSQPLCDFNTHVTMTWWSMIFHQADRSRCYYEGIRCCCGHDFRVRIVFRGCVKRTQEQKITWMPCDSISSWLRTGDNQSFHCASCCQHGEQGVMHSLNSWQMDLEDAQRKGQSASEIQRIEGLVRDAMLEVKRVQEMHAECARQREASTRMRAGSVEDSGRPCIE